MSAVQTPGRASQPDLPTEAPAVPAAAARAAQFSHIYQRQAGPIVRTVYAQSDRVMVAFDGEDPYILHIMWSPADAVAAVESARQATVDEDHAWALQIDRRRRYA